MIDPSLQSDSTILRKEDNHLWMDTIRVVGMKVYNT